jgi:hypothetical protein
VLVHAHGEQARHAHWLMNVDAELGMQAPRHAHDNHTPSQQDEHGGPTVLAPVDEGQRILVSLPACEVVRDRGVPSVQDLDWPAHPGANAWALGEHPSRATPIRDPPICLGQSGSGSQRILRLNHALRI